MLNASNSIMPNLYAYCNNDPVNHIDPTGFDAIAAAMTNTADFSGMLDTIIPALSTASVSLIASVKALIPALWNIFVVASLIVIIFAIIAGIIAMANALVKYVQDTIKGMGESEYENQFGFWVYVLTRSENDDIFYVGRTKDCSKRYKAHEKTKGSFFMYPVIPCKTERGSKAAEQALISACIIEKVFEMDTKRTGTGSNKIRGIAKQYVNAFKNDLGDITALLAGAKESDLLLLMGY